MHDLPADWNALCAVVLLLGLRHGFDADHLAAIDGLTRVALRRRRACARYCGTLFSLGHGVIVLGVASAVGLFSEHWAPPGWMAVGGAWISIGFLLLIGILNLRAVLATAPGQVVSLVGLKEPLFARWRPAGGAASAAAVGALFALSFDTLSQSALFAVAATRFGGPAHAMALGGLFVLGMAIADGLNGWWIARLITRADQFAARASRIMGWAVSGISLLVAAVGIARLLWPGLGRWGEGKEWAFGALVVAVIAAGYLVARRLAGPVATPRHAA